MKKIISCLLTITLCLSLLPVAALATDETVYAIFYDDGELVFQIGNESDAERTVTASFDAQINRYYGYNDEVNIPWYSIRSNVKEVTIKDRIQPKCTAHWFRGMENLVRINQISNLDTTLDSDMLGMFARCKSLESLDVSGFDTSSVTDMRFMFLDCGKLSTLDVSGFDTSNVRDMTDMFGNCKKLTELDVSGFDTSKVADMEFMFSGCQNLETLDVSNFDTSNVILMMGMFHLCGKLTDLDVSKFDTAKVTRMDNMFDGCISLSNIDVSGFNTAKVTTIGAMFKNCKNLLSVDVSGFDTSEVTSIGSLFMGCQSLTELDISNFNTSKVTYAVDAFNGCSELATVVLGDSFTFKESVLPTPTKQGYTGEWRRIDSYSAYTSAYIRDNYPSSELLPGTYVWVKASEKHNAIFKADDTVVETLSFLEGATSLTEPTVPAKDGFTGIWEQYDLASATSDITINAVYMELPKPTHIATFTADGATVATISFIEGDESLDEPAVPAKNGYTGAWETYDLASATSDITINAVYTAISKPTHTATFVADGATVSTITFTEGDESLTEPTVPAKDGFFGAWETYDLANATADITVNAIYTAVSKPVHTATFRIGGTVIAAVPFTEGDTALDEPNIPDKPNYVGAWDAYDLASAKSDITVEGRYTPVDPDAVSDLGGDAEASYGSISGCANNPRFF